MNQSLRQLQIMLGKRVQKLSAELDEVADFQTAQDIIQEMQEFNHRVTLTGQLLFREQSTELEEKIDAVRQSTRKVDKAIREISELREAIGALSNFLALVDEAIDLAKTLPMR